MNRRENAAATLVCGLAGDVVRTFGEVRLRVFGTSMVPSILPGDLISVQRAGVSEISSGEVVLYVREGRMFVHRVVDRGVVACAGSAEHLLLITRGDRLRHNDPPVSSAELLGRVISIERGNFQMRPAACLNGWERTIVRLLRYSDHVTYLYTRLVTLRLVGARHVVPLQLQHRQAGVAMNAGAKVNDPDFVGAPAHNPKAPTHKPDESFDGTFDGRLRTEDTEGAVECQA